MTVAGTPVIRSPSSSVNGSTDAAYSAKLLVARRMNVWFARPAWMISRAIVLASAMSVPTSSPSQVSAQAAEDGRRGSTATRRAPLWGPLSRWWKKIGCGARAFEPHSRIRSVCSISSYDDVPPPAPNTVARPTTLGACQVRLQESMLFDPITCRANLPARKFISFDAFEHENIPKEVVVSDVAR